MQSPENGRPQLPHRVRQHDRRERRSNPVSTVVEIDRVVRLDMAVVCKSVRRKVLRKAWFAVTRKVAGSGHDHPSQRKHIDCLDNFAWRRRGLQANVQSFLHRIANPILLLQLDLQIRVFHLELAQIAREVGGRERRNATDSKGSAQAPLDSAHLRFGLVELRQDSNAAFIKRTARVRDAEAPGRALQQLQLQVLLKLIDPLRHHGLGCPHLPRRLGKAAHFNHLDERSQTV